MIRSPHHLFAVPQSRLRRLVLAENRGAALEVQSANAESGAAQIRAKLSPA